MNRVAPTTARSARPSSGLRSYGCKVSFATNLVVRQAFLPVQAADKCPRLLLLLWARAEMQRRNSASQILVTNFRKAGFLHHRRQLVLIRKP